MGEVEQFFFALEDDPATFVLQRGGVGKADGIMDSLRSAMGAGGGGGAEAGGGSVFCFPLLCIAADVEVEGTFVAVETAAAAATAAAAPAYANIFIKYYFLRHVTDY